MALVLEKESEALNIDRFLGPDLVMNRINQVGIELEGAWRVLPPTARRERDGSVLIANELGTPPFVYVGEVVSEPRQPAAFPAWMRKYYPDKVNRSCGLHVHMSFDTVFQYGLLSAPEYQETILEYLKRWAKDEGLPKAHCIWERLGGGVEYCRKIHWPDQQIRTSVKDHNRTRHGNRYTVINYCHALHGTLECRVLPMFDTVDVSIRAVRQVIDITNACLAVLGSRREAKLKERIVLGENEQYEEFSKEIL